MYTLYSEVTGKVKSATALPLYKMLADKQVPIHICSLYFNYASLKVVQFLQCVQDEVDEAYWSNISKS